MLSRTGKRSKNGSAAFVGTASLYYPFSDFLYSYIQYMDLTSIFEPLKIIHWEWTANHYSNDYLNEYKLDVRALRDDKDVVVGFAAIMKSHLSSNNNIFLSYIAQQDVIVPELHLMSRLHFEYFLRRSQQLYVDLFYEKMSPVQPEKLPFQVFLHPEDLDSLYTEFLKKLQ